MTQPGQQLSTDVWEHFFTDVTRARTLISRGYNFYAVETNCYPLPVPDASDIAPLLIVTRDGVPIHPFADGALADEMYNGEDDTYTDADGDEHYNGFEELGTTYIRCQSFRTLMVYTPIICGDIVRMEWHDYISNMPVGTNIVARLDAPTLHVSRSMHSGHLSGAESQRHVLKQRSLHYKDITHQLHPPTRARKIA
ncbi:hypothetical protein BJX65DRAFT_315199 [Aspergillus insuetus]